MTPARFEGVLRQVANRLTDKMRNEAPCRDAKAFEKIALDELSAAMRDEDESARPAPHPHAFPDLLINGFGVEVKHTIKDTWLAVGNSIFEGMRDSSAQKVYVLYGKMGGWPEVRWARYEDCVSHVRISHAPRFVIDMEDPASLFRGFNMTYDDFSKLSPADKMAHVRRYYRGRLREGEQIWWLEDLEKPTHSLPITVTIYRHLPNAEKRKLRAEAALLCPEVVGAAAARGKYDRAGLYLITRHGIFAPQLRDLFSAGSVGARGGRRGHTYIIAALADIETEMKQAAEYLDDELFVEYWGGGCLAERRIAEWLVKADSYATEWTPSAELFKRSARG